MLDIIFAYLPSTISPSTKMTHALHTALAEGIRYIGIGKYGSKPLPHDMVQSCCQELLSGTASDLQKGAFFGALVMKGISETELPLESVLGKGAFENHTYLLGKICPDLPERLYPIGIKLLKGHSLGVSEAYQLGAFLFSNETCEGFRGMAASILRVRYETNDEYKGLHDAILQTYSPGFQRQATTKLPIIQIAEPFDGVEHSYLITPLIAHFFQKRGYNSVATVGRTPGPKYTLNAYDLFLMLGTWLLQDNHELLSTRPEYGWILDQKALSPALNAWVDRRRMLIKRPFLSTLEKVLNPCNAKILVTSVFHITYQMKMAELALMAGFDGVMVLKRGMEGSLSPATARSNGILCGVRTTKNHLFVSNFDSDMPAFASYKTASDEQVSNLTVETNAALVREFVKKGQTAEPDFDNRTRYAQALYGRGLTWIEEQWKTNQTKNLGTTLV